MSVAQLVVRNAAVYTCDPHREWADGFAVVDGRFQAVDAAVRTGPDTEIIDAGGRMILPGLCDIHIHLGFGGAQQAWELPIAPTDSPAEICAKVAARAAELAPGEWVVGGIVGSAVMDAVATAAALADLDAAAQGHPVLLRDDTQHNRWVNSATLAAMGVEPRTPDPEGGSFVRDAAGRHTGVLREQASRLAETVFVASIADPAARDRVSLRTAAEICNRSGITTVQEAATMAPLLRALARLEGADELTLRVVASTPMREFLESGVTGAELIALSEQYRSPLVHPDFVKVVLDGVPMTRTSALLTPYPGCADSHYCGEILYTLDELVDTLETVVAAGRGAKIHATGDAAARIALDAIAVMRSRHGGGPRFHLAHTEHIAAADTPRFAALDVVADASPFIWYPGIIQDSNAKTLPAGYQDTAWPLRDLLTGGTPVAAGSDWPCAFPLPDPWIGLETMITRQGPGGGDGRTLNGAQALTLPEALLAFTRDSAQAMGLGRLAGSIEPGKSADFIVLNRNLFDIAVTDIHRTRVLRTYFQGREVFSAE
ncbi:amidohydrolase [Nocardia panacis]|uniref:Amidohydrolase n=1 Tax=Nocardia panacis TaxID=2340916 RepID=A0A3A4KSW4_9NOCA|nr:amidohydrolase [Nocardia panacis]RJO79215.1 amidohydrolase [Nocardia panacis]